MRTLCSLALLLAACDRPQPLVICHNANCTKPDVSKDDTLDALTESLDQMYNGTPMLDGIELDTFWFGAEDRCLFAHDLNGSTTTSAFEAAQLVADYLQNPSRASWNGERFYVFIELKGFVGESFSDEHTDAQRQLHAECALQMAHSIYLAAQIGGHELTIGFISIRPRLLETLTEPGLFQFLQAQPGLELMLIGDIFAPFDPIVPDIADFKMPLDAIEYHPRHLTVQHREAYRALGLDLVQWQFVTTSESFAAIRKWEPKFVITNEAEVVRRWTDY